MHGAHAPPHPLSGDRLRAIADFIAGSLSQSRPAEAHLWRSIATTLRTMIAIMEQYQQEDGTIEVPMAIRPYLGGQAVIGPQPPIGPART